MKIKLLILLICFYICSLGSVFASNNAEDNFQNSLNNINQEIYLNPNNDKLYFERCRIKYSMEYKGGALKDINKAISIKPSINYYYVRGQIFAAAKNYEQAIDDYKQVLEINPNNKSVLHALSDAQNELIKSQQLTQNKSSQKKQQIQTNYKLPDSYSKTIKPRWYNKLFDFLTYTVMMVIIIVGIDWLGGLLGSGYIKDEQKENPLYSESVSSKIKEFFNPEEAEKRRKQYESEQFWKQYWDDMSKNGWEFEGAVGKLYKKMGYKVTITQGTGDGGVDLILKKDGETTIVQCKAHKREVGPEPVRALWGVLEDFNAQNAIFIAYSGVTTGAREFASRKALKLIDSSDLVKLSLEVNKEKV